jgi:hypothetical protein
VGRKLSEDMQDGISYRYGIVNLGGRDRTEVLEQFAACRKRLGMVLLPISSAALPREFLPERPDVEGAST